MRYRMLVAFSALSWASLAGAQATPADWGLDLGALAESGSNVLQHAPNAQLDELFQALRGVAQDEHDAQALCNAFGPDADRSLQGLDALAAQLDPTNRARLATALADVLVAAVQSPAQSDDRAQAAQGLKAAGVTAALLHDGFVAGLQRGAPPRARCQSLRWLLDAMQARPPAQRASMTRLLLDQGLAQLSASR